MRFSVKIICIVSKIPMNLTCNSVMMLFIVNLGDLATGSEQIVEFFIFHLTIFAIVTGLLTLCFDIVCFKCLFCTARILPFFLQMSALKQFPGIFFIIVDAFQILSMKLLAFTVF